MQSLGCVGDCKDTPGVERGALAPARQHAQYGVSRDSSLKDFPERGGRASFEVANRLKCRRFVDLQTDHQPTITSTKLRTKAMRQPKRRNCSSSKAV